MARLSLASKQDFILTEKDNTQSLIATAPSGWDPRR